MSSPAGSWLDAWARAAYGPEGFWPRSRPGEHFRTASTSAPELAEAVLRLLDDRPDITRVVEVGAGDGRLLAALHRRRPRLRLVGTDLRPRPVALPAPVGWVQDLWDVRTHGWATGRVDAVLAAAEGPVLLLALEWLDDLPCRLAVPADDGWRELDAAGQPGPPLAGEDRAWTRTWWPAGEQVEVGTTRDRAWAWLVRSLAPHGGLALMVDYGHERTTRPAAGSLAAYRDGRPVAVRPAPDRNLTAHVAVDAVAAAGEETGARTLFRRRQADLLAELLPVPTGPVSSVDELAARSRRAALASPRAWGGQWWLLQEVPPAL